jgi:glycerate 2-kinase
MASVNVPDAMRSALKVENGHLHVGDRELELGRFDKVLIAAIGKAAVPMTEHVLNLLRTLPPTRGVVVGLGSWVGAEGVQYVQGGHPIPDAQSLYAAHALLQLLSEADEKTLVIFLISGGASAMAEAPLSPAVSSDELFSFYRKLLLSGLPIEKLNTVRKHFSAVKGGRLALACGDATRCTVLLSDVPAERLDVVGSGPSLPDTSTVAECRRIITETPSLLPLAPSLQAFLETMPETPKVLPEGVERSICFAALSSDSLIDAAARIAKGSGYRVVIDNTCDDWDYREAANYLFKRAVNEALAGTPVCILSAGEVTVSIAGAAGTGGRNQQWSLEMARHLNGRAGMVALSAGSDGIDGNSPAAGAVVDGSTWTRIAHLGQDGEHALAAFDTYPLFERLGDAIICGATGNNLRDLRVILIN